MPDQPEAKPTVSLPAVPPWAAELTVSVKRLSGNIDNVISAVDLLRERVNAHDTRFNEQDERAKSLRVRVQSTSDADLEQQAKIADVIIWRKSVTEQLADRPTKAEFQAELKTTTTAQTKELVDELKKNPTVQKILTGLASAVTTAGGLITYYLATKGH
jgi:polyribonucleotide nucleotidyltransferase